jgi:hypothetical protein
MGIYLFKVFFKPSSLWPGIPTSYSFNYLATSETELPETSIQVFENNPQVPEIIQKKIN